MILSLTPFGFVWSFWLGLLASVAPLLWQQQSLTRLLFGCILFSSWDALSTLGRRTLVNHLV